MKEIMLSIKLFFIIVISLYLSKAKSIETTTSKKLFIDGRCGKEFRHCREGYRCSRTGWCVNSDLHCKIEGGRHSEFGQCHKHKPKDEKIPIKVDNESSDEEEVVIGGIINEKCGGGYGSCKKGYCCSRYGWCGKSNAYCSKSKGCQPEFGLCISKPADDDPVSENLDDVDNEFIDKALPFSGDGRCGKGVAVCKEGFCCSKYGWCGKTDLYCKLEEGCQLDFGVCNQVGIHGNKDKPGEEELPISKNGRCGKGVAVCGEDSCCSGFGWCGKTKDHCEINMGCQTKFGTCYTTKSINVTLFNYKENEIYNELTEAVNTEEETTDELNDVFKEETTIPFNDENDFFN